MVTPADRLLHRRLELFLAGIVAFSFLLPGTRELEVLTWRYLFDLQGQTLVQGQPPGCVIVNVPNVEFSDEFREEALRHSSESPDAFLLAYAAYRGFDDPLLPPAETWRGHPLEVWAALATTKNRAGVCSSKAECRHSLLEQARAAEPWNGALWAAQAILEHDGGDDSAAFASLREAFRHPRWDDHRSEATRYFQAALEAQGLPALSAREEVSYPFVDPLTDYQTTRLLEDLFLAEVGRGGASARELANMVLEARRAEWLQPHHRRFVRGMLAANSRLSAKLKRDAELARDRFAPPAQEWADLLRQGLTQAVGIETATALLVARDEDERAERASHPPRGNGFEVFVVWGWARALGLLHLLAAALLLAFSLPGLAFRLEARLGKPFRPWWFWLASALCCSASAFAMFRAFEAFDVAVGFRSFSGEGPALSPTAMHTMFGCALATSLFALHLGSKGRRLRPLSLAALVALPYLATAIAGSMLRAKLLALS